MIKKSSTFMSIREAARHLGIGETWLRNEVRLGNVPYITAGVKVLVNVPMYTEMLDTKSKAALRT